MFGSKELRKQIILTTQRKKGIINTHTHPSLPNRKMSVLQTIIRRIYILTNGYKLSHQLKKDAVIQLKN